MNQSNNLKGQWIPSDICNDTNLNPSEKRVLATIQALDNDNNCYSSNSYLAECTYLSARQVSRVLQSLEKKGYIEIENGKSFKRKIKIAKVQEQAPVKVEEVPLQEPAKEEKKVVPFSGHKNNTYKPKAKKDKFHSGYSHGFNYTQLEQLETQYIANQLDEMHHDNLSDRAKELLSKVHIDEEPSEWLGVNQLKI